MSKPLKLTTDPGWQLMREDDKLRLDIYDAIGDYGDFGVSAVDVVKQLDENKGVQEVEVHINSPGGSAFDGITIYNRLKDFDAMVTVYIDGLAASAASIIAMAGDDIIMAENAMLFIHNASGLTVGNAKDHLSAASELEKLDTQIARTYARRTGGDEATIREQMSEETTFDAEEAVADGFATRIAEAKRMAACYDKKITEKLGLPDRVASRFINQKADAIEVEADTIKEASNMDATSQAVTDDVVEAAETVTDETAIEAVETVEVSTEPTNTDERERCSELAKSFSNHGDFLAESIASGWSLAEAKAEAFDRQLGFTAPASEPEGVEPVKTASTVDPVEADVIKNAKRMKTKIARDGYLNAKGASHLIADLDEHFSN